MINPTEEIRMTAPSYLPQFMWNTYKYCNTDFYITTGGFKEMCVKKYDAKGYQFSLHPFKVEVINDKSNWR